MLLFTIVVLIGYCRCDTNFDNTILRQPPWKIKDCDLQQEAVCNGATINDIAPFQTCTNNDHCTINVAVMLPNDTNYIVNIGEVENRIKDIATNNLTFNLSTTYSDDQCKQEFATLQLTPVSNNYSHVLFGPICDYCLASVSRVAKYMGYYGLPVITSGGFAYDFSKVKTSCSNEYFMSINVGPMDFRSLAEFFYLIMNRYKWKKIALMYEKSQQNDLGGENTCKFIMESVVNEVTNRQKIDYQDGDLELIQQTNINYTEYLKDLVGVQYGIILTCTSHKKLRQFAIDAYNLNMTTSGEYIVFNFETYSNSSDPSKPWHDPDDTEDRNEMAKKGFRSIYTFTPISEANFTKLNETQSGRGAIYLDMMADGLLLYASAIEKLRRSNDTLTGMNIVSNMMGTTFEGQNGPVTMNCNGQRVAEYVLLQMNEKDEYSIGAIYTTLDKTVRNWTVKWLLADGDPLDTPRCGFDNSRCPKTPEGDSQNEIILLTSLILVVFVGILIVGIILYRHFKLKSAIYKMAWKINFDEILIFPEGRSSFQSTLSVRRGSQATYLLDGLSVAGEKQLFTTVGFYKGIRVAVKLLQDVKFELTRSELLELKLMKDLSHDNLVKFYGACLDIPNCILSEYCPKGSLQDILENDHVQLDTMFKMSLIMDIVRGMNYLHTSALKSHGALKSTNCLVDNRFVLKITDFGLPFLRRYAQEMAENTEESYSYWQKQLWTAPELLRIENPPVQGTQKGDIYSFGIIMHEIIERQGPFYLENGKSAKEKVDLVRKGPDANGGQPLRPSLGEALCDEEVDLMMKKCWSEDPDDRPDFSHLKTKLKNINKEAGGNLLDNMVARMEQYANNLESLVEERTSDYLEEKRKCEEVLYQLLPKSVAQHLINGESVIAETFNEVTIHFSDIVGFTALSANSSPLQVVDFLNDLYTCFDSIIVNFDVYKVETIGDSYMVVSGLPVKNGQNHAREIVRMSLALLNAVKTFKIRHRPEERLQLRIGIHTGPCVAGVVGLKMPRYCLFGDTVNTASRMETNGQPLRIHISEATKKVLDDFGTFDIEQRGEVELKGKGKMVTYWVNGEFESTPYKPSTPMPGHVRKQMSKSIEFQENQIDEAEVPLLSVTSPPNA